LNKVKKKQPKKDSTRVCIRGHAHTPPSEHMCVCAYACMRVLVYVWRRGWGIGDEVGWRGRGGGGKRDGKRGRS